MLFCNLRTYFEKFYLSLIYESGAWFALIKLLFNGAIVLNTDRQDSLKCFWVYIPYLQFWVPEFNKSLISKESEELIVALIQYFWLLFCKR